MRAILTPDDLKKGDLVDPGWYNCVISKYEEKAAEGTKEKPGDGSTNCIFYFKVEDGKHQGVEFKRLFNEKALGFGKNLWAALKFPSQTGDGEGGKESGYALSTELFEQSVGSRVQVYVKRAKSDRGTEYNDPQDFRAVK